jgi:hypothetical protein
VLDKYWEYHSHVRLIYESSTARLHKEAASTEIEGAAIHVTGMFLTDMHVKTNTTVSKICLVAVQLFGHNAHDDSHNVYGSHVETQCKSCSCTNFFACITCLQCLFSRESRTHIVLLPADRIRQHFPRPQHLLCFLGGLAAGLVRVNLVRFGIAPARPQKRNHACSCEIHVKRMDAHPHIYNSWAPGG